MNIRARLDKLESEITPTVEDPDADPEWFNLDTLNEMHRVAYELFQSLPTDYRATVDGDLDRVFMFYYGNGYPWPESSELTHAFCELLIDVFSGEYKGPLTIPDEVATAYLTHGHLTSWRCVKCRYPMPFDAERKQPASSACPVCGAATALNPRAQGQRFSRDDLYSALSYMTINVRTEVLLDEMTGNQKQLVRDEYIKRFEYYESEERRGPLQLSRLTELVIDIAHPMGSGKECYIVPAKLPADIVAAWLDNGPRSPDDCEDCGYPLPGGRYESCPLCGGAVGKSAYKIKHKHAGYAALTPYGER